MADEEQGAKNLNEACAEFQRIVVKPKARDDDEKMLAVVGFWIGAACMWALANHALDIEDADESLRAFDALEDELQNNGITFEGKVTADWELEITDIKDGAATPKKTNYDPKVN